MNLLEIGIVNRLIIIDEGFAMLSFLGF